MAEMLISDAALLYALRELSRRAGVSFEFFSQWKILRTEEGVLVQPEGDAGGTIAFPVAREEGRGNRVTRKSWGEMVGAQGSQRVTEFVVPFSGAGSSDGEPLFVSRGPQEFRCSEDLLTSILLTLCRDYYLPLLEMLRGAQEYDWESELRELRKEGRALAEKAAFWRQRGAIPSGM